MSIALVLAMLPGSADAAGTYTVWSCRTPDGQPLSSAAWRAGGTAGARADTCAAGGGLSVSLGAGDTANDAVSGFRFTLPVGATVSRARIWMSARSTYTGSDGYGYAAGPAFDEGVGVGAVLGGCPRAPDFGCTFGEPGTPLAAGNLVTIADPAQGGLSFIARCTQAFSCVPATATDPPVAATLYGSAVDVDDPQAPTAEPPVVRTTEPGRVTLAATASDGAAGVARIDLVVDGTVLAGPEPAGACREPYVTVAPCPSQGRATFDVLASHFPPGAHQATVRVTDAAGNTADSAPTDFVLAPTTPIVDPPVIDPPVIDPPVVDPPAIVPPVTVRIATPRIRVALPARGPVAGTVRRTDGTPVAGLVLDVREGGLDANGRTWRRAGTVTTAADGTFRVAAGTVSRMLRLTPVGEGFAGDPVEVALVRPLAVSVERPRSRLRNGQRLTLRGRLAGAGRDARGRTTVVQAMVDGDWRDVDTVTPSSGGQITWRYRFRHTRQAAIYRFRLRIPAQAGLPWKTVTSKRVSVRVDP